MMKQIGLSYTFVLLKFIIRYTLVDDGEREKRGVQQASKTEKLPPSPLRLLSS